MAILLFLISTSNIRLEKHNVLLACFTTTAWLRPVLRLNNKGWLVSMQTVIVGDRCCTRTVIIIYGASWAILSGWNALSHRHNRLRCTSTGCNSLYMWQCLYGASQLHPHRSLRYISHYLYCTFQLHGLHRHIYVWCVPTGCTVFSLCARDCAGNGSISRLNQQLVSNVTKYLLITRCTTLSAYDK